MEKVIIVAGKASDATQDFCGGLGVSNRNVVTHGKEDDSASVVCVDWNRASALGARTFVLKAENRFRNIDEAVLIFDEEYFASRYGAITTQTIPQAADEMLLGYHYLCQEILSRYEKKSQAQAGQLVFLLKMRKERPNNLCAVYVAAFEQFAQVVATMYRDKPFVNVFMIKAESSNDLYNNETELAKWLCSYLDSGNYSKQSSQWIKAGAKIGGGWKLSF